MALLDVPAENRKAAAPAAIPGQAPVEQARSEPSLGCHIDLNRRECWFELLAQLDFYDAKILEHVYGVQGGATTLLTLVRQLRRVGIKREALRRRVLMLADVGLLNVALRTKPLCISGRIELEGRVLSLIAGVYQRLGVTRS